MGLVMVQLVLAVLATFTCFFVKDAGGAYNQAYCIALASIFGPASISSYILLALATRKTVFVELIIPSQIFIMTATSFMLHLSHEAFDERASLDHILFFHLNLISLAYVLLTLFLSASWLVGILMRLPSFFLYLACMIFIRSKTET